MVFAFWKESTRQSHHLQKVQYFTSHIKPSKAHLPNLNFKDSQILECLKNQRFRQAFYLLDETRQRNYTTSDVVYWTSLLSKYSKHGHVDEARRLFDLMPRRNIVSYNVMLSSYVHSGRLNDALGFFEGMVERNVLSWTCMVCGLANMGRIEDAKRLFGVMPERNVVSWNAMMTGLLRNGNLNEARWTFEAMPVKNEISWNVMITGYVENNKMVEARGLFEEMECPNAVTWTAMISGYCRVGDVKEGLSMFQRMPERNVVSWTAMIGGFAWNGFYEESLSLFLEMRSCDVRPNMETFLSLIYACAGIGFTQLGKQVHACLMVNGWDCYDNDGRLSKSLIHMYSTYGIMDYAQTIFTQNHNEHSAQTFNHMIHGYIQIGDLKKAQDIFNRMPIPDKFSWTSLINGYFDVGMVMEAWQFFNSMPEHDDVSWTAMISGLVQNELFQEALNIFSEMRVQGFFPLGVTYSVLIGAAGAAANLEQGTLLHCLITKTQSESDLILQNSLIAMYAKCGEVDDASRIFTGMNYHDLISWNSMIMGFSYNGQASEALKVFREMLQEGRFSPNSVTFLGTLSACNHAGLVDQGWELFRKMSNIYAVQPDMEHYISMINLLGRAGKVKEAEEFVLSLPFEADHTIWGALLGICGVTQKTMEIARRAGERLLELDPFNAPAHVALCNPYAANGQYVEEGKLRKEMGFKGVKKVPGCSWSLLRGKVHVFFSGDMLCNEGLDILLLLYDEYAGCSVRTESNSHK